MKRDEKLFDALNKKNKTMKVNRQIKRVAARLNKYKNDNEATKNGKTILVNDYKPAKK